MSSCCNGHLNQPADMCKPKREQINNLIYWKILMFQTLFRILVENNFVKTLESIFYRHLSSSLSDN